MCLYIHFSKPVFHFVIQPQLCFLLVIFRFPGVPKVQKAGEMACRLLIRNSNSLTTKCCESVTTSPYIRTSLHSSSIGLLSLGTFCSLSARALHNYRASCPDCFSFVLRGRSAHLICSLIHLETFLGLLLAFPTPLLPSREMVMGC